MKDKIIVIAVLLTVGCVAITIVSGSKASQNSKMLDQERYNRMVAEEKLEKALAKVQSLESALTSAQNQAQSIQDTLAKEKTANEGLKTELEKTEKLKQILENELKNSLVTESAKSPAQGQQQ